MEKNTKNHCTSAKSFHFGITILCTHLEDSYNNKNRKKKGRVKKAGRKQSSAKNVNIIFIASSFYVRLVDQIDVGAFIYVRFGTYL